MKEHAKANDDLILLTNITVQPQPNVAYTSALQLQKLLDTSKGHTVVLVKYSFIVINMASVD